MTGTPQEFITAIPGLLAFWDFQELPGRPRRSRGPAAADLCEANGPVPTKGEGVFGPLSAAFGGGPFLYIQREKLGRLNVHGLTAEVSLVTWLKRQLAPSPGCQAVAGIWNEHSLRQYCLFLNLRIWDSAEQVGAHISGIGSATPGYKYCMDAAIGATPVSLDQWHCCAISYDGQFARAYLDGQLDQCGDRNPYHYPLGIFTAADHGADFTVGAVSRPERVSDDFQEQGDVVANRFHGLLGGLAVFDRALDAGEMAALAAIARSRS